MLLSLTQKSDPNLKKYFYAVELSQFTIEEFLPGIYIGSKTKVTLLKSAALLTTVR